MQAMNIRGSFLSAVLAMTVLSSCSKVDTVNDWIYQLDDNQLAVLKYLRPLGHKSSPLQFLVDRRSPYIMDDQYLRDPKILPVHFLVDGKSSDDLTWVESGRHGTLHNDHQDKPTADQIRWSDTVRYRCKEFPLQLDVTLTHYRGYSVIEYDAVLTNEQDGQSPRIQNLQAIDETIGHQAGTYVLHAVRGSTYSFTDFEPLCQRLNGTASYAVTNGKCTSDYMPCFNLENATAGTGIIAVLNWQGNWKVDFTKEADGIRMTGGQYQTDFVLQPHESVRFPGVVLMLYKGDWLDGQNEYRRWLIKENLCRYQENDIPPTNALICPDAPTEAGDLAAFELYKKTGVTKLLDKFNKDAGWYDTEGHDWPFTGNWFVKKENYPNGLKPLSDAAHGENLQFALWLEPERIVAGTKAAKDLAGKVIALGADGKVVDDTQVPVGTTLLVNYADPSAVDYVIDMLDKVITEHGVDQYRQDFNMFPGQYWAAWDAKEAKRLGCPRTGITENHYTEGYLRVFSELLERHPNMFIDACASGGMRYDLETLRYAFLHTRSDFWADIESAQCQTFGCASWIPYWGTGFTNLSLYDVRSHIGNSIGVGAGDEAGAAKLEEALTEWRSLAKYLQDDYYPLTAYAGKSRNPMAMQFGKAEEGMIIAYFREDGSVHVMPRGLIPERKYQIWNRDKQEETLREMSGAEIMGGLTIESKAATAIIMQYKLK